MDAHFHCKIAKLVVVVKEHNTLNIEFTNDGKWTNDAWNMEHGTQHKQFKTIKMFDVAYERIANDTALHIHYTYVSVMCAFYVYFIAAKWNVSMVVIHFTMSRPYSKAFSNYNFMESITVTTSVPYSILNDVYIFMCSMCSMSGWKLILIRNEKWFIRSPIILYYNVFFFYRIFLHSFVWIR